MYDYVIFHKHCIDGFTGFLILHKSGMIDKKAQVFPDVPSAKFPPSGIEGKSVIIIDVAYKYSVLKEIMMLAKKVTFIDHHITIKEDVIKIVKELNKNHEIIYDDTMSGASLTWKYFYPDKRPPLFVKYVEDNDTGTWKMKHTLDFITGLEVDFDTNLSHDNLSYWSKLYNIAIVKKIIKRGRIYNEYKNHLTRQNSKRYTLEMFPSNKIYSDFTSAFMKPGQYKVVVFCGSGCPSTTSLGKEIMDTVDCDFVIMWSLHLDKKEYVLAFRSLTVDVGSIAGLFGGGGHKLAAACSFNMNKYNITDLFFPHSLPRASKITHR
jgi:oligoribonuclease NrnB/cAMP/cGMP phosphodiesterase (DHH superfamily)